jgi:DNA-binding MarR family transcriptional regulator
MASQLQRELKLKAPFKGPEQEALISIARTASQLTHAMGELLRPYGITPTQYNVLRVLKGAGSAGLCRNEIGDRLVTEVPDVTRLLDRMEESGLIARERGEDDRRLVYTTITRTGTRLLATLQKPVSAMERRLLAHLGRERLGQLNELLADVRRGP